MTGLVNKIGVQTQERRLAMNDFGQFEQTDETMLICDVPDEAIENAAGSVNEKARAFSLDTCPT
jgi:hypothetical protein